MDILELLRSQTGFTGTEKKIADYIVEHRHEIGAMSVSDLARETFSSNASIIRMCRKIGLPGYQGLKLALLVYLSAQGDGGADAGAPSEEDDSVGAVMEAVSRAVRDAADDCLACISGRSISCAAGWISRANRLFLYGDDLFDALRLAHRMSRLGVATVVPGASHDGPGGDAGDTALIVSCMGGPDDELEREMASLRRNGCRVILISTGRTSPEADLVISLPGRDGVGPRAGTAYSRTVSLYLSMCMEDLVSGWRSRSAYPGPSEGPGTGGD